MLLSFPYCEFLIAISRTGSIKKYNEFMEYIDVLLNYYEKKNPPITPLRPIEPVRKSMTF